MVSTIDDRLLKVRIRELSYEAAMATEGSHRRYVQFFSEMVDAIFLTSAPEIKAMAITIARGFDYATDGESALSSLH